MSKVIISEGKTTNEAIEEGLRKLNVSRDEVEIKVLEQEKRSFFSILQPRTVKVELKLKEEKNNSNTIKEENVTEEDLENIKNKIEKFLKVFLEKIDNTFKYEIYSKNKEIYIDINGEKAGTLIGYRGETLNSLQTILLAIANQNMKARAKIYLNIDNYKEKRKKALEELAMKVSKTVIRNNKSITLEPMNAYERKVIHTKLQDVSGVTTHSVGEEPNRRIIIEKI